MQKVSRAVCASVCRIQGSVMDQLLSIRNELCAPGVRNDTRFALLYASGWFVLWIEGSEAAVDSALKRAAADPRNEHQKILHRSRGPASLDERVVVATTQSPMRPTHFARWVMHMMHEGRRIEPLDIWQRLGAPCLAGPSLAPCTRPLQQFAIVSSDDHGPVCDLRKIGERCGSPVVYQRFAVARSHMPDLGMAYVDVPVEHGAARVRVVSRKALAQASVRRSMPALDGLAVLLGTRPSVALELVTNVADALKGRQSSTPTVWVAGNHVAIPELLPMLGLDPRGFSVSAPRETPAPVRVSRTDGRARHPFLASTP